MSSKADRDNRSNQLNPNNSAYQSSRGVSGLDDDDTYSTPSTYHGTYVAECFISKTSPAARTEIFGFGAVSMDGHAVYRTATFAAPGSLLDANATRVQLEDYLNGFERLARSKFERSFRPSELAIFVVFDPTESCLSWHVPLMHNDLQTTRSSIVPDRLTYVTDRLRPARITQKLTHSILEGISPGAGKRAEEKERELASVKLDPSPFIEALRTAVSEDAQSWGVFNVPYEGRMNLDDQHNVLKALSTV